MKRKIFIAAGIVAAIFIVLAGIKAWQIHAMIAFNNSFCAAAGNDLVCRRARGRMAGHVHRRRLRSTGAERRDGRARRCRARSTEIALPAGAIVAKGDLLIRLDTSSEQAQLRSAEAQTELARLNAERTRQLRADKTVSPSELDTAEASLKQLEASADEIRATIDKKTIRAPFAGRLGIRLVNLGASAGRAQPHCLAAIAHAGLCEFFAAAAGVVAVKTGLPVQVTCDAYPGENFDGTLTTINPDLDVRRRGA